MEPRAVRLRDLLFPVLLMVCGALGLAMVTRVGLQGPPADPAPGRTTATSPAPKATDAPTEESGPRVRSLGTSAGRPAPGPAPSR